MVIDAINQMLSIPLILQWRQEGRDGVSNQHRLHCLLTRLFRRRSKKTSKLRVTGFCEGNSPATDEFPAQRASNVSIWWRHHERKSKVFEDYLLFIFRMLPNLAIQIRVRYVYKCIYHISKCVLEYKSFIQCGLSDNFIFRRIRNGCGRHSGNKDVLLKV